MGELTKALLKHRIGVGAGMVLVGLIAAGVLADRRRQPPVGPAEAFLEPEADPVPPVGRAGLFARLAATHEQRRSAKTYRQ